MGVSGCERLYSSIISLAVLLDPSWLHPGGLMRYFKAFLAERVLAIFRNKCFYSKKATNTGLKVFTFRVRP